MENKRPMLNGGRLSARDSSSAIIVSHSTKLHADKINDQENECDNVNGVKTANLTFPYSVAFVDEDLNKQLLEDFKGERTGFVQVGPEKWFFPSKYMEDGAHFYNFEVRSDDTWVVTYPRSGTTWTQELVWLLSNDLDFETAAKVPLTERFPFLEFSMFIHDETKAEFLAENAHSIENQAAIEEMARPGWQTLAELPSPRFIKTHFPFSLLPQNLLKSGCKVIYVARNPKDVAVSFYYLNRLMRTQGYKGDFKKYWNYFEQNLHPWTPYWTHIKEGWERRHQPNVLFMFYEEMNKNFEKTIAKVSDFLGKSLSDVQLKSLTEYLNIKNFSKNKSVNMDVLGELGMLKLGEQGFVRKGKNGEWKEEFSADLKLQADMWIENHIKNIKDFKFPEI